MKFGPFDQKWAARVRERVLEEKQEAEREKRCTKWDSSTSKGTSSNPIVNLSFKTLAQVLKQVQIYSYLYFIQKSSRPKTRSHNVCIHGWWVPIARCTSRRNYIERCEVSTQRERMKKTNTHTHSLTTKKIDTNIHLFFFFSTSPLLRVQINQKTGEKRNLFV